MNGKWIDWHDILLVAGLVLVGFGLGYIYWPAALIVVGGILLVVAIVSAWMRGRNGNANKPVRAARSADHGR